METEKRIDLFNDKITISLGEKGRQIIFEHMQKELNYILTSNLNNETKKRQEDFIFKKYTPLETKKEPFIADVTIKTPDMPKPLECTVKDIKPSKYEIQLTIVELIEIFGPHIILNGIIDTGCGKKDILFHQIAEL